MIAFLRLALAGLPIFIFALCLVVSLTFPVQVQHGAQQFQTGHAMAARQDMGVLSKKYDTKRQSNIVSEIQSVLYEILPGNDQILLQLTKADLQLAFAIPDLKRREGNHQIWQYQTEECIFDLFLSGEKLEQPLVVHYEMRQPRIAYMQASDYEESGTHKFNANYTKCMESLIEEAKQYNDTEESSVQKITAVISP